MRILTTIFFTITTLLCSVSASASGSRGPSGAVAPAPTAIVLKFHIAESDPAFSGQLEQIREIAAQYLISGNVCDYSEIKDTLVVNGPLFQYVRIEFYSYDSFLKANKDLANLDPKVEIVSASGKTCGIRMPPHRSLQRTVK